MSDLDVRRALAWVLQLSVKHLLTHKHDPNDLSLAVELLKTIRDEPDTLPKFFEYWELDPDAALVEQARIEALAESLT